MILKLLSLFGSMHCANDESHLIRLHCIYPNEMFVKKMAKLLKCTCSTNLFSLTLFLFKSANDEYRWLLNGGKIISVWLWLHVNDIERSFWDFDRQFARLFFFKFYCSFLYISFNFIFVHAIHIFIAHCLPIKLCIQEGR